MFINKSITNYLIFLIVGFSPGIERLTHLDTTAAAMLQLYDTVVHILLYDTSICCGEMTIPPDRVEDTCGRGEGTSTKLICARSGEVLLFTSSMASQR